MARTAKDGISYVRNQGYRIVLGKTLGEDGKERYRTWWLGHDKGFARYAAKFLRELHALTGAKYWSAHNVSDLIPKARHIYQASKERTQRSLAKADGKGAYFSRVLAHHFGAADAPTASGPATHPTTEHAEKIFTLYEAIAAFLKSFKGKAKSDSHKQRMSSALDGALKRTCPDCPLTDIDFLWVDKLCDHFKARPKALRGGKPIATASVKGTLTYFRIFFTWLDDAGLGGWQMPRRAEKCFRIREADLKTHAEHSKGNVIKQFNIPTLNPMTLASASSLVTTGIFRFTRNPMYLGMLLILVGWSVVLSNAFALLAPVAFVLYMNRFQIAPEEQALTLVFGPAYIDYQRRVRRWL